MTATETVAAVAAANVHSAVFAVEFQVSLSFHEKFQFRLRLKGEMTA